MRLVTFSQDPVAGCWFREREVWGGVGDISPLFFFLAPNTTFPRLSLHTYTIIASLSAKSVNIT